MLQLTLVLLTVLGCVRVHASIADIERGFKDIVLNRGYAVEEHHVLTQDGYILTLFRIPGSLANQTNDTK